MFKHTLAKNRKIYALSATEQLNVYCLNILSANEQFASVNLVNDKEIAFEVSNLISLPTLIKESSNEQLFAALFYQLCELADLIDYYGLNQNCVFWDKKYIFYDPSKCCFKFILLPIANLEAADEFRNFIYYVSEKVIEKNAIGFLDLIRSDDWKSVADLSSFFFFMQRVMNYSKKEFAIIEDVSNDARYVKKQLVNNFYAPNSTNQSFNAQINVNQDNYFGSVQNEVNFEEFGATEMFDENVADLYLSNSANANVASAEEEFGATEMFDENEADPYLSTDLGSSVISPGEDFGATELFNDTQNNIYNSDTLSETVVLVEEVTSAPESTGTDQSNMTVVLEDNEKPIFSRAQIVDCMTGQTHQINKNHFVIGKADECDFTVNNLHVSGKHLVIDFDGSNYYATDTNSTNGTYLNGFLITPNQKYKLNSGDAIYVANYPIRFNILN